MAESVWVVFFYFIFCAVNFDGMFLWPAQSVKDISRSFIHFSSKKKIRMLYSLAQFVKLIQRSSSV